MSNLNYLVCICAAVLVLTTNVVGRPKHESAETVVNNMDASVEHDTKHHEIETLNPAKTYADLIKDLQSMQARILNMTNKIDQTLSSTTHYSKNEEQTGERNRRDATNAIDPLQEIQRVIDNPKTDESAKVPLQNLLKDLTALKTVLDETVRALTKTFEDLNPSKVRHERGITQSTSKLEDQNLDHDRRQRDTLVEVTDPEEQRFINKSIQEWLDVQNEATRLYTKFNITFGGIDDLEILINDTSLDENTRNRLRILDSAIGTLESVVNETQIVMDGLDKKLDAIPDRRKRSLDIATIDELTAEVRALTHKIEKLLIKYKTISKAIDQNLKSSGGRQRREPRRAISPVIIDAEERFVVESILEFYHILKVWKTTQTRLTTVFEGHENLEELMVDPKLDAGTRNSIANLNSAIIELESVLKETSNILTQLDKKLDIFPRRNKRSENLDQRTIDELTEEVKSLTRKVQKLALKYKNISNAIDERPRHRRGVDANALNDEEFLTQETKTKFMETLEAKPKCEQRILYIQDKLLAILGEIDGSTEQSDGRQEIHSIADLMKYYINRDGQLKTIQKQILRILDDKSICVKFQTHAKREVVDTELFNEILMNAQSVIDGVQSQIQTAWQRSQLPTKDQITTVVTKSSEQLVKSINKIVNTFDEEAQKIEKPDLNQFFDELSTKISAAFDRLQKTPPEVAAHAQKMQDNFTLTVNNFLRGSKQLADDLKKNTADLAADILNLTNEVYTVGDPK